MPLYNYPWVVLYRKSFFKEKGYTVPKTWDEFITLAKKMQADGLVPLAFADKDGWPAMGTFDILNMRMNGYQFHVDLMAGKAKWTDPKVKAVFEKWAELLPYYSQGAPGRTWQDAAKLALVDKKAGMYFLGTFANEQAGDAASDVGFFPFPLLGNAVRRRERDRRPDRRVHDGREAEEPRRGKGVPQVRRDTRGTGGLRHEPGHRQRGRLPAGRYEQVH